MQSLGRRFDQISFRLLEQDQTFNQIKGDLRRLYQDTNEHKQHRGEITDAIKAQQGEISLSRGENGRAVQTLRDMLNGVKLQMDKIQSQNLTRGTEGGTLNLEVGDEIMRLMAG